MTIALTRVIPMERERGRETPGGPSGWRLSTNAWDMPRPYLCRAAVLKYRPSVSTPEILWFAGTLLVMLVGVLGCILPAIPGTPLIFAAAVAHRLIVGESGAQTWVLVTLGIIAILALAADYAAALYGAKALGASRLGMTGAVIGGLVGLFLGPFGILLGPFVGAFSFEFVGGRAWHDSAKAGAGATIGLLVGAVGKVACAVSMTLLFAADILWRAFSGPSIPA